MKHIQNIQLKFEFRNGAESFEDCLAMTCKVKCSFIIWFASQALGIYLIELTSYAYPKTCAWM